MFTTKAAWDNYSAQCAAINYGTEAGISNATATADNAAAPIYNLMGQRIQKGKGICIRNGKKFVMK